MDYEKKYKEALDRARIYRDNAKAVEEYSAVARYENIFPELREEEKPLTPFQQCLNCILRGVYYAEVPDKKVNEFILNVVRTRTDELVKLAKRHEYTDCQLHKSKDERIRKALIDALKMSETIGELKFRLPYPTREECIAYLEKQKEHHIPWYDYQKSKEAGYTIVPNEEYEQLIKQKEQKPEDKEITLTNFEEVLNTFLFDFANSPIEDCEPKEYTKKHSAEILKAAYAELNAQLKQDIFEAQQEGRREGYEAAKAEQKPAEWSEEDEKMVKFYEDDYNNNLGNMPMRDVIENRIKFKDWLLNRLKSLRPQPKQGKKGLILTEEQEKKFGHLFTRPSWKPSEEQMKGLKFFLDFHRPQRNAGTTNWREYDAVESLYEQLKKL